MQLTEGPMTLRDLSIWFGLKPDTLAKSRSTTKEKKFQKLRLFCDFHFEGKKLIIDEVFIPEYTKAFSVFEEEFPKEWGYIVDEKTHKLGWQHTARVDSCNRVAQSIQYKHPEARQVKTTTASSYVSKVKTELYGRTYKEECGTKGYCQIVYLNKDESGLLSNEQMKILEECRIEAYKDVNEQRYKLDEARAMGEITKAKWQKAIGEVDAEEAYSFFQALQFDRLGFIPVRRTQLIDD